MTKAVLKQDTTITPWRNIGLTESYVFPKGTEIIYVGGNPAIASERVVAEITGNAHDAKYRWVWVNQEDVEELE